jgi:hypothetical protein
MPSRRLPENLLLVWTFSPMPIGSQAIRQLVLGGIQAELANPNSNYLELKMPISLECTSPVKS